MAPSEADEESSTEVSPSSSAFTSSGGEETDSSVSDTILDFGYILRGKITRRIGLHPLDVTEEEEDILDICDMFNNAVGAQGGILCWISKIYYCNNIMRLFIKYKVRFDYE